MKIGQQVINPKKGVGRADKEPSFVLGRLIWTIILLSKVVFDCTYTGGPDGEPLGRMI